VQSRAVAIAFEYSLQELILIGLNQTKQVELEQEFTNRQEYHGRQWFAMFQPPYLLSAHTHL
jgi:hypothetical protein